MAVNRYYSNTAIATTLSSGINNSTTTVPVAATTGFPVSYPYTLVIDEGTASEELITVNSAVGTTLTVTRGADSTTATTHSAGAAVRHVVSARDFREPQEHIDSVAAHGATGAVVGTTNTQTLSNKTISLGSNTVSGTTAQFNTALSDGDFATQAGTETLTNKTINLGSNTVTGTLAQFSTAVSDADLVGVASTQTLTGKTMSGASNTFSAIPSSAVTGLDTHTAATAAHGATGAVVGTTNTQTLSNKTLSSPTLTGIMSGSGSIDLDGTISVTNGTTCEISLGYGGGGGLSIAQAAPATHPNGVVLWVSGTTLYARKPNGTDVALG